jgi:hypothetical protein
MNTLLINAHFAYPAVFNAGENGSRAMKVWTESKRNKHTKYGGKTNR